MKKLYLQLLCLAVTAVVTSCAESQSKPLDPEQEASRNIATEFRKKVLNTDSFVCEGVGELDEISLHEQLQSQIAALEYDISLNERYVETIEKALGRKATGFRKMKDLENERVQHKIDSLSGELQKIPADEVVYIRTRYYYQSQDRNGQMVKDSTWVLLNPDLSVKLVMN